ncbi:hypothetical protein AB0B25_07250 [Nocardia sp. NPDC049190]|uniref:hypothetical protein n=1 Tax=Nocardia sp. NPDC049190 TaxID=3155650 RepID=UPI0033DED0BE
MPRIQMLCALATGSALATGCESDGGAIALVPSSRRETPAVRTPENADSLAGYLNESGFSAARVRCAPDSESPLNAGGWRAYGWAAEHDEPFETAAVYAATVKHQEILADPQSDLCIPTTGDHPTSRYRKVRDNRDECAISSGATTSLVTVDITARTAARTSWSNPCEHGPGRADEIFPALPG